MRKVFSFPLAQSLSIKHVNEPVPSLRESAAPGNEDQGSLAIILGGGPRELETLCLLRETGSQTSVWVQKRPKD